MKNKQTMTRTTELLKGCRNFLNKAYNQSKCGDISKDFRKKRIRLCIPCRRELKGRLDALKEEVEFIKICAKNLNTIDYEENDRTALAVCRDINYRLASIQEEIKLIEGKI